MRGASTTSMATSPSVQADRWPRSNQVQQGSTASSAQQQQNRLQVRPRSASSTSPSRPRIPSGSADGHAQPRNEATSAPDAQAADGHDPEGAGVPPPSSGRQMFTNQEWKKIFASFEDHLRTTHPAFTQRHPKILQHENPAYQSGTSPHAATPSASTFPQKSAASRFRTHLVTLSTRQLKTQQPHPFPPRTTNTPGNHQTTTTRGSDASGVPAARDSNRAEKEIDLLLATGA